MRVGVEVGGEFMCSPVDYFKNVFSEMENYWRTSRAYQ
jgi:hypothetical protein